MTVDEAKKILHEYLNNPYGAPVCGLDDAIKIVLSIVEDYQKIEQIISSTDYIQEDVIRYQMICEVVEDGQTLKFGFGSKHIKENKDAI